MNKSSFENEKPKMLPKSQTFALTDTLAHTFPLIGGKVCAPKSLPKSPGETFTPAKVSAQVSAKVSREG